MKGISLSCHLDTHQLYVLPLPQNKQVPITLEEAFRLSKGTAVESGMYTEYIQNNIKSKIRERCLDIQLQLLSVGEDDETAFLRSWKTQLSSILTKLQVQA